MPPKPTNWGLYGKMLAAGALCCIAGPALVYYISPTEEELFLKYNPDLQKRSLERRVVNQEEFDNFVGKLKEYSKSDKPIWDVAAEADRKSKDNRIAEQAKRAEEVRARKDSIRKSGQSLLSP